MCGLVFVGGKTSLSSLDMEIFSQFLQCDTYRGDHSTGVCAVFQDGTINTHKAAVDGFDFVKTDAYSSVIRKKGKGKNYYSYPITAFGHNRYATMGAINATNAHPFTVKHITLAHNGTLTAGWKGLLPDGDKFSVDSACVANSVATIGIEETAKRLIGAFTLIWHDAEKKTLNILRNNERPFHLWETTLGDWFGCSEEKMGDWLLTRGKYPKKFKRHFECVPGIHYVFDISKGCVLKSCEKIECSTAKPSKQEVVPFNKAYSYDEDDYYDAWWKERAEVKANTKEDRIKELLKEHGVVSGYGEGVEFSMYNFTAYGKVPGKGYVRGYLSDVKEFVEIHVHDIKAEAYKEDGIGYATILSAYATNGVLTIIGKSHDGMLGRPDKEEPPFEAEPTLRTTTTGETFTEKDWNNSHHNVCSMCGDPIGWEEVEFAAIENGYCFCGECGSTSQSDLTDWCDSCGEFHDSEVIEGRMTSAEWTELAVGCRWKAAYRHLFTSKRPILSLVKKKSCVSCGEKISKDKGGLCSVCYDRFCDSVDIF